MEVPCEESPCVPDHVPEILFRKYHWRDEILDVAREPPSSESDQRLMILIKNEAVFRAIDSKLMDRRTHLRREGEIGCGALLIANDHPEFIDYLVFVYPLQEGAYKAICDHPRRIAGQKLRDPRHAVADDVMQQLPR